MTEPTIHQAWKIDGHEYALSFRPSQLEAAVAALVDWADDERHPFTRRHAIAATKDIAKTLRGLRK